jgi:hypothetical protein
VQGRGKNGRKTAEQCKAGVKMEEKQLNSARQGYKWKKNS